MANFSTEATGRRQGLKAITIGNGFVFSASGKSITRSDGGSFLKDGFIPDDIVLVSGAVQSGNNRLCTVDHISPDGTVLYVKEDLADEAAGASVTIGTPHSYGTVDLLRYCTLEFWSGTMPADGDAAEVGALLGKVTLAGGAVAPGAKANGLTLSVSGKIVSKPSGADWSGVGIAAGTIGYAVLRANNGLTGATSSTNKPIRIYCTVGTSSAEIITDSMSIKVDKPLVVSALTINDPN